MNSKFSHTPGSYNKKEEKCLLINFNIYTDEINNQYQSGRLFLQYR